MLCNFSLINVLIIQLVPGYRGYTIDSIRQLTILDDIRISADEKHFFKGLSKLKGMLKRHTIEQFFFHFCNSHMQMHTAHAVIPVNHCSSLDLLCL